MRDGLRGTKRILSGAGCGESAGPDLATAPRTSIHGAPLWSPLLDYHAARPVDAWHDRARSRRIACRISCSFSIACGALGQLLHPACQMTLEDRIESFAPARLEAKTRRAASAA